MTDACMPRSRGQLLAYIDSLDVENNPKFQRRALVPGGPVYTFCNQFIEALLELLGVAFLKGKLAREQIAWLDSPMARALGWYECTEEKAQQLAEAGQPVVAGWVNPDPKEPSHVAMVAPAIGGTGTHIAQAGFTNFSNRPISHGFGVEKLKTTRFFTHA